LLTTTITSLDLIAAIILSGLSVCLSGCLSATRFALLQPWCDPQAEGQCGSEAVTAAAVQQRTREWIAVAQQYFDFDSLTQVEGTLVILLLMTRVFRSLRLQPRLAIISRTIVSSIPDLTNFVVVFTVVLVGFAASFNCNYGNR
jgi:hypothetical protein